MNLKVSKISLIYEYVFHMYPVHSKHSAPWLCSSYTKVNCLFQEKKKSKSKGESKDSSEAATESSQDKQEKTEGMA